MRNILVALSNITGGLYWQGLAIVVGEIITRPFIQALSLSNFSDVPFVSDINSLSNLLIINS